MQDQMSMMRYSTRRIRQWDVVDRVIDFGMDVLIHMMTMAGPLSHYPDYPVSVCPVNRMNWMSFKVRTDRMWMRVMQAHWGWLRIRPADQWVQPWHITLSPMRMVNEVMLMNLFLKRKWPQLVPRATHSCQRVHTLPVGRDPVDMGLLSGMDVKHFLHLLWPRVHVTVHVVL
jgi:hypothetical protein